MASETTSFKRPPRALQQINLNAIYTSDTATSSDEDLGQETRLAQPDVQSLVRVSLGPEQNRLNSPTTPAIEKAAAIEANDGFFGPAALDQVAEDDEAEDVPKLDGQDERGRVDTKGQDAHVVRPHLPSPWRSGPKLFQRTEDSRAALRDTNGRKRSSSGAAVAAAWDNWQKSFMSSIPSLPKSLTFSSSFSAKRSDSTATSKATSPEREVVGPSSPSRQSITRARSKSEGNALNLASHGVSGQPAGTSVSGTTEPDNGRPSLQRLQSSYLRKSMSDHSLYARSALSRVSTLGDDTRFEHVQAQVNSRAKAIRDSFQDSNIKLPSLSSLSLESFKPDFSFYNKNGAQRRSTIALSSTSTPQSRSNPLSPTESQVNSYVGSVGDRRDGGPTAKVAVTHPHFTKACAQTKGDLVILGGYRGSILRSAEPPHIQLWAPVKVGLGIRKVDLEIGLNVPEDDMKMESKIIPGGMLSHIGPVDISKRLFRRLRASEIAQTGKLRVHDYGYDWRLDPHYLSQRLIQYLEGLPCNGPGVPKSKRGATVIAHSLGGLITRHAVNQRPDLFAGVVYAGTPTTCVNILGPLRAGDDVLLSSKVLTAQVNFTIRTSYALLPLDGKCFFNKDTKEEFPVDFFDPQTWIDNSLSPCVNRVLPALDSPPPSMMGSFMSSIASSLPSLSSSSRRGSLSALSRSNGQSRNGSTTHLADIAARKPDLEPSDMDTHSSSSVGTQVTLPREAAIKYLTTTLARVKKFKLELDHNPVHQEENRYPPQAVIYGKSTPTVYGAKVKDRDTIRRTDAYKELAFASGDGVVLARAAMLPPGYELARGGLVNSERGHITLLGDLEAVGRALNAINRARSKGCGLGKDPTVPTA
ncbi:hypothetical protein BDZ85DRAFT_263710 [Elsinoe ampelina]|uniref:Lecithin:cholesterol acyltransferase-domain-containing protein n=1 Tax=Elsinoe ampelina TaxID=302913 RepID=A0A6A6G9U2_9PEZI|nr:hypothetical protein BDZ85DRAFT_263710 [Elsinoe ampelina]